MIQTPATEIIVHKPVDEITIKDLEDVMAGVATDLVVEVVARQQVDNLVITKAAPINLTIKD